MQRVTIIPVDGYVSIDGRSFDGMDLSTVDPQIHALQWYGSAGEIELAPDDNGRVANIVITDLSFVQPALDAWQAAADAEDNPPLPSVMDVASICLNTINRQCGVDMTAITAGYPESEIKSWDKQEAEARAYTADSSSATPMLSALAVARGISVADLAQRVIGKADIFASAAGEIIGKRQALEDQINAIIAANALPTTDPAYIDDGAARAAIEQVIW